MLFCLALGCSATNDHATADDAPISDGAFAFDALPPPDGAFVDEPDADAERDGSPNDDADLPLDDAGAGSASLAGFVVKGPAANVLVEARALGPDGPGPVLAEVETDEDGHFVLRLPSLSAPLELTARGAADGRSRFADEARGESVPWPADRTLSALVPAFWAELPPPATSSSHPSPIWRWPARARLARRRR